MSFSPVLGRFGVATLLVSATAVQADVLLLDLPVRCDPQRECIIQNYVDHDPGAGRRDYQCGYLTYDGHTGTDFRLRDLPSMRAGVAVVAAAAGRVAGVRDGELDISVNERGRDALQGKDAGNAVRIDHGDGWETQYSHLLKGSVKVRIGDRVEAGTALGLIGLSGRTEFPHVDFAVRHAGKAVDPFNPDGAECGQAQASLWSRSARQRLGYVASGELLAGFSTEPATRVAAEAGQYAMLTVSTTAPMLSFWAELFGALPNDRLVMRMEDGNGRILASGESTVERPMAVWFGQVTKRQRDQTLSTGRIVGQLIWMRGGQELTRIRREINITDPTWSAHGG